MKKNCQNRQFKFFLQILVYFYDFKIKKNGYYPTGRPWAGPGRAGPISNRPGPGRAEKIGPGRAGPEIFRPVHNPDD
jgi:hypothetical protein